MFPGKGTSPMCNIRIKMKRYVYADNAATTQLDEKVLEAMLPYLTREYGNASQPYSFARSARQALKDARETVARCINAKPSEVFFTSGGSESDNWAIKGAYFAKQGEIIISSIEHHAVINTAEYLKKFGCRTTYLPVDKDGRVKASELEKFITEKTSLVSVMTANNEIGTIEPIKELARVAHANNVLFHTDAVQAVGHIDVDVKDLGVDMMSASAHKFNGPKGVGFLYKREGIAVDSLIQGGAQEFGKRAGTENIASIVGMAIALKNNCDAIRENTEYIKKLECYLIKELQNSDIKFIQNGDVKNHIPGNISLSFGNIDGEALLHRLDLAGVAISTGAACDSKKTQVSHVLDAIKVPHIYAKGTIRISLGKYNTEEDVQYIASTLKRILI